MKLKCVLVIISVAAAAATLALAIGVAAGRLWEYSTLEQYELDDIANRLQVSSDWEAVRSKVYCEVLVLGKERDDIERELESVGPYRLRENVLYYIYFDNYFARRAIGDLALGYDANNRLDEKWQRLDLGERVVLNCP